MIPMQAQLASNVTSEQARYRRAAYGERGSNCSLSHRQNYGYHRIGNGTRQPAESNFTKHCTGREKIAKGSPKRGPQQAQKFHQLGFSYLASSFHYILRKCKAFYNGFLGDVASTDSGMGSEAPMVDPYFSIPVLPQP